MKSGSFFIVALLSIMVADPAGAVDAKLTNYDEEFAIRRQNLDERYQDYLRYLDFKERLERDRLSDAQDIKKYRLQILREMEQARLEFIRNRKPPYIDLQAERAHELEKIRLAKEYEARRKEYIHYRDELRRVEKRSRYIPPEEELGLVEDK